MTWAASFWKVLATRSATQSCRSLLWMSGGLLLTSELVGVGKGLKALVRAVRSVSPNVSQLERSRSSSLEEIACGPRYGLAWRSLDTCSVAAESFGLLHIFSLFPSFFSFGYPKDAV